VKRRLFILLLGSTVATAIMLLYSHYPRATGFGAAVVAALAVMMVVGSMWRESRRLTEGELRMSDICVHCGYDVRATPDRCPECGMRVEC
jgi:hypothetical protein